MRNYILLCLIGIFVLQSCTNRDSEIVELIKSIQNQTDEVKVRIINLQGIANNALADLNKFAAAQVATDTKINAIYNELTSILNQLNTLNAQMAASNANALQIKAKIDVLQTKCDELIAQVKVLNRTDTSAFIKAGLSNGLVAYYPFNGNANDIYGIKGFFTGNYLIGYNKLELNALNFSGSDYLISNRKIDNVVNNFSFSAWVNPNGNVPIKIQSIASQGGDIGQPVIHPTHGSNWGDVSTNAGVGLYFGNNQIQVIEHSHLYVAYPLVHNGNFNDWNLIVVVYDNHVPKLYLNGQYVAKGEVTNMKFVHPSNGNDFTTYGNYSTSGFGSSFSPGVQNASKFKGKIDDIGIWNRVLTETEIKYLYQNSFVPN